MKNIYLFSTSSHPNAISIKSLEFTFFKPDIDFSKYDYLVITSKQALNALKQYDKDEYIDKKGLCVSDGSAKSYKALGGSILDLGDGYGMELINIVKKYPKKTRWLYPRAKVTATNFYETLQKDGYNIDDYIVYQSSCSKDILEFRADDDAVLIFTSPSSVNCYLKNNTIKTTHKVVVIGRSTADALPSDVAYETSDLRDIESCIKLAINFSF